MLKIARIYLKQKQLFFIKSISPNNINFMKKLLHKIKLLTL